MKNGKCLPYVIIKLLNWLYIIPFKNSVILYCAFLSNSTKCQKTVMAELPTDNKNIENANLSL